jgi:hypothetical protein
MFIKRKFDKIVVVLVLAGIFIYASFRPSFHLRTDMPAGFMSSPTAGTGHGQNHEAEVANAYWKCAVTQVQWKYGYGYQLPETPPAEFAVASTKLSSAAIADTRDRYWRNLRELWYDPNTWVTEYKWDFRWAGNPLHSAGDWLRQHFSKLSL